MLQQDVRCVSLRSGCFGGRDRAAIQLDNQTDCHIGRASKRKTGERKNEGDGEGKREENILIQHNFV